MSIYQKFATWQFFGFIVYIFFIDICMLNEYHCLISCFVISSFVNLLLVRICILFLCMYFVVHLSFVPWTRSNAFVKCIEQIYIGFLKSIVFSTSCHMIYSASVDDLLFRKPCFSQNRYVYYCYHRFYNICECFCN